MGRLKENMFIQGTIDLKRIKSKMVPLKVYLLKTGLKGQKRFQFKNGSIKRSY